MEVVFEFGGKNAFREAKAPSMITLYQHQRGSKLFRLVYGLSVKDGLSYEQACSALGAAILHLQSCEGIVDNGTAAHERA